MPAPRRHRFIAIDEGLGNLLHVDQCNPAMNWLVPIGWPQARDMQLVGQHRVLISHHHGFSEFDVRNGRKVAECTSFPGVTAARRQPDGTTLVAGLDLNGQKGISLLSLDADYQITRQIGYPGDYIRLLRQTATDSYLFMCDSCVREADDRGNYLAEFSVPGFRHAWKALRLANGHILASAGYGAFMVEIGPNGNVIRQFGGADQVPPEVNPYFYGMFQLLADGHVVVANWQGHDAGHGHSGIQLLEFDPHGQLVWQWDQPPEFVSSLQGVVVLDDLDTTLLHDERLGPMQAQPH